MKKIFFLVMIFACVKSFSQSVSINTTGNAANASAMLDVSANNKGLLIPRMTTAERQNIPNPANGLMVFDVTTNTFWYFSTMWKEITNGGGGGFVLPYNGSGTIGSNLFSIVNTSISQGSSSIYGRSGGTPSGLPTGALALSTTGVWGDNVFGYGVLGTTADGNAILGVTGGDGSGVYGLASGINWAGVYGSNLDSGGIGVMSYLQNGGTALVAENQGPGYAARFESNSVDNSHDAVYIYTQGQNRGLSIASNNSTNTVEAARVNTNGLGRGMTVQVQNTNSFADALRVYNQGKGNGIEIQSDNGIAGNYMITGSTNGLAGGIFMHLNNDNAASAGLSIMNDGTGTGITCAAAKGAAGMFTNSNPTNSHAALEGTTYGTSVAGIFEIFNATNSNAALSASTSGTGPGLLINNTNANAVSSLATFRKNGANKARIDGTGKGYFNGGTQTGGADVAEVFDVTGSIQQYETGDVLVISVDKDRTVEKSSGSYSTLVAGVYATKPGVLLTEENIDTDISDKVPMGVVGVIPTKVCLEGGVIKRGDLLVTSSIPGVAMKADPEKVKPGQVIGKALQGFDSNSVGKINVLVSVK
jgi:hypothetical protein